jgi:hypothetical protein
VRRSCRDAKMQQGGESTCMEFISSILERSTTGIRSRSKMGTAVATAKRAATTIAVRSILRQSHVVGAGMVLKKECVLPCWRLLAISFRIRVRCTGMQGLQRAVRRQRTAAMFGGGGGGCTAGGRGGGE